MSAYRNGEIPLHELTVTSIGVRLRADAAASVERMAPAFRAGVGHALRASDGYRALAGPFGQTATFESRYPSLTHLGVNDRRGPWTRSSHRSLGPRWWYRLPRAAAAAVPGTSNHGWAVACDFAAGINSLGTRAHNWMRAHAGEYGWVWPGWAQRRPTLEPWHWEYDPSRDRHRGSGGGGGGGAAVTPRTVLELGDVGDDVADLQRLLGVLPVDGSFGPETDRWVRAFQERAGLVVDGQAGPSTFAALRTTTTAPVVVPDVQEDDMTTPFRIHVGSAPADQQAEVGKVYLCAFGPTGTCMFQHVRPSQNLALERAGVPLRKILEGGKPRDFSLNEKNEMRRSIVELEAKWKVAP